MGCGTEFDLILHFGVLYDFQKNPEYVSNHSDNITSIIDWQMANMSIDIFVYACMYHKYTYQCL